MKDIEKLYIVRRQEIVFDNEEDEGEDLDDNGQEETQEEETQEEETSEYDVMDVGEMTSGEVTLTNTYTVDGEVYTWDGKEYATVNGNISVGGPVYRKKGGFSNDVLIVVTPEEGDATVLRRMLVTYASGCQSYKYYELKVSNNDNQQEPSDDNG